MKFLSKFLKKSPSLICGAMTSVLISTAANADQLSTYTYSSSGQVLTEDGPRTDVSDITTYTYDTAGNRATATNALSKVINYNSYDSAGRLLSVTDANNITTEFTYHTRGWLLSSKLKDPVSSTLDRTTSYGYDAVGNITSMTLPNGYQLLYEYDGANRLKAIKNVAGERIEYTLDLAGNRTQEVIKNSSGTIKYSVNRAYDELSRVMAVTGNNSQNDRQQYDVNDNPTIAKDGRNNQTQKNYDALNRVKKIIDPNLNETQFTYNGQDRIKTVTDARGNVTTYNYDGLGNLTSQTSPDTGTTTFLYDNAGNRTKATDARGVVANYTYDALNRLKTISYPGASIESTTFGYDDTTSGAWGINYGVGRLTKVENGVSIITFKYDPVGLIKTKRATVNGITFVNSYTYDAANNLTSITYPSGRIVTYTLDSAGRVQAVKTKLSASAVEQTVMSNINYLPFGPASDYLFGNGLTHTASYDNDYRLTGITVGGIMNRSYGYDPVNNITSINDLLVSTKNQTFGYDVLNRLTSATGVYGSFGYTYDQIGNRLTETSATQAAPSVITTNIYSYPTTNNRLTSVSKVVGTTASGTRNFTYDDVGNRTQGTAEDNTVQDYTYNKANRLETTKVTGSLVGTYAYDVLGRRVSKTIGTSGVKELYMYDEAGQLIAVTDAAGNVIREYIYNGDKLISVITKTPFTVAPIALPAAAATLQGGLVLATTQTGYTGSTGYISGNGQATWTVTIPAAGNYNITVRYANDGTARPVGVIDGVQKATMNFPATVDMNTWSTVQTTISMSASVHTFKLSALTSAGCPNIDKVDITFADGQATPIATTLYYVHTDHRGAPQVVTAQNQSVAWMADYQPFGKLQSGQVNSIDLYSRFPGQFLDNETGLYYNYFRDYDPSIGRYIESDPIGLDGGINTYGYVEGNPIKYTDPTGQMIAALPAIGEALSGMLAVGAAATMPSLDHKKEDTSSQCSNKDPDDECAKLIEKINIAKNGIARRFRQLLENKGDIDQTTHLEQLYGRQRGLRNLLNEAATKGCQIPSDAWYWASK